MNQKLILFLLCWLATLPALATLKLHQLFANHMVLQQQARVPIWGWAKPGAAVTLQTPWNKALISTKAAADGRFRLWVQTPKAGGPYALTLSDGSPLTLQNVLIGEVWLASGQSNMQMPVKGFHNQPVLHATELLLDADQPQIRLFNMGQRGSRRPLDTLARNETWTESNAATVSEFSAVAWQYALILQRKLKVPIGLISATWGGTVVESWMSDSALAAFPTVRIKPQGDTAKLDKNDPAVNFNALINPLIGYGIKGVIWYQGEQNRVNPQLYKTLLPAMVADWRRRWGQGNFPFYYVQIAPYLYPTDKEKVPFLREAQSLAQPRIAASGMICSMDAGIPKNVHPPNKGIIAHRLALQALNKTYGFAGLPCESPVFASVVFKAGKADMSFAHAPNGFNTFGKEVLGFELAGADSLFYPAKAAITRRGIEASATEVPDPKAVRYAFKEWLEVSVYSNEGLPLFPFRSDNFPIPATTKPTQP